MSLRLLWLLVPSRSDVSCSLSECACVCFYLMAVTMKTLKSCRIVKKNQSLGKQKRLSTSVFMS